MQADLEGAGELHLQVTVDPVRTGLVPRFPEFSEGCPVSGPSLQYVAVSFALVGLPSDSYDGPAAHLTVTPGPSTPGDIGDVGVFFGPSPGHDVYCTDYPPLPTTDAFWSHGGPSAVTGYVVLDQAVTAATPEGRADVLPTLQARIDHLRVKDSQTLAERTLNVSAVRTGIPCEDDADAFCIPSAEIAEPAVPCALRSRFEASPVRVSRKPERKRNALGAECRPVPRSSRVPCPPSRRCPSRPCRGRRLVRDGA